MVDPSRPKPPDFYAVRWIVRTPSHAIIDRSYALWQVSNPTVLNERNPADVDSIWSP